MDAGPSPLDAFHAPVREWFNATFATGATPAQTRAWPPIHRRENTLLLAPTGSGKTLAAFLHCLDRLMFEPRPRPAQRCRVVYVSPLKALAVDVERNLRVPLAGIARLADAQGAEFLSPTISVRTGDTHARERARFRREPTDILITTPESLYLLLTSQAREALRSVDTVIIDEIHALVPTKRGAHLAVTLERLQTLTGASLQRIGLSATQRPLDEVARFLGGVADWVRGPTPDDAPEPRYRPVTCVDAGTRKQLELHVEAPADDPSRLVDAMAVPPKVGGAGSSWDLIHPRLVELVRTHQSTLIFVNSRRLAERLAAALNDVAGEPLVRAHHGSLARLQRLEIEESLKAGLVRGLVATSSLELGIDMGAIDLVVQIEPPPSVAAGLQRVGRAGHQVGAPSQGILIPRHRGELLATAALVRSMRQGDVEPTRYLRSPLDIVAQQIIAMAAIDAVTVDTVYATLRHAAPFVDLSRRSLEGVLDLLSGRYPSDDFAQLKPRLTWDRELGTLTARPGAARLAITQGGTIPDRGLYGVFLIDAAPGQGRVGELDEEMVFESRLGDVFLLGASSWRIEEITHDRVLVSPAPGQPGRMPFWHGEAPSRPVEVGQTIGALARVLAAEAPETAVARLERDHSMDSTSAHTLVRYLTEQTAKGGSIPTDRNIVVERFRDELGDWRICVLSPLGGRVLVPWMLAVTGLLRERRGLHAETAWGNDGFVLRLREVEPPPSADDLLLAPDEIERRVVEELAGSAMFAARFREAAGRALLLPKRFPGQRSPLWQQRQRSADLLAAASRFPSFPILLEAYRECLRDVFDLPALIALFERIHRGEVTVTAVDSVTPSPMASSVMFAFAGNFIYDDDAPAAERRAQALTVDLAELHELLGEPELRRLLDPTTVSEVENELQCRAPTRQARDADGVHDLLLKVGDLSREELAGRCTSPEVAASVGGLVTARRVAEVSIGGGTRFIASEDAARYRDALGVELPSGIPPALLEPVTDAVGDLARRFARTHAPFTTSELASRFGWSETQAGTVLADAEKASRVRQGAFRAGGTTLEWCDAEVLKTLRARALARLRKEIEPVDGPALARFLLDWHGIDQPRTGLDATLDVIEQLQGAALPASLIETEILPARIEGYLAGDLDALISAGEVLWVGVESLGERDGRVALYLTDRYAALVPPPLADATPAEPPNARETHLLEVLAQRGPSFFEELHAIAGGLPSETVDALWSLVWQGLVTNDGWRAMRSHLLPRDSRRGRSEVGRLGREFRSRRSAPAGGEGRWSRLSAPSSTAASPTAWGAAFAQQLLARYGVMTRDVPAAEGVRGGFSALYPVFRALEESGRIRRGFFVGGVAAMQFALPGVLDRLRKHREAPAGSHTLALAADDPANPYGSILAWPTSAEGARHPTRGTGATVVLRDGALIGYLARGERDLLLTASASPTEARASAEAVARALIARAQRTSSLPRSLMIETIDGVLADAHPLAPTFIESGFQTTAQGLQLPLSRSGLRRRLR